MFTQWLSHDGDWLQVCYTTGLRQITSNSTVNRYRLMTRTEIEAKFVNPKIVAGIIKTKTEKNLFVPHPDAPDEEDARLYKMFDTTLWEHLEENRQENTLEASNHDVDPTTAATIATAMMQQSLAGPLSISKQGPLTLGWLEETSGTVTSKAAGGKPSKPGQLTPFLKAMARVVQEVAKVDKLVERVNGIPKTEAFIEMLQASRKEVNQLYDIMREQTSETVPDMEALKDIKTDIDGHLNSLRLDCNRVAKMFPDLSEGKAAGQPKGKAKAKAKASKAKASKAEAPGTAAAGA